MPRPAILVVDHGSRRAAANELLEDVAAMVRARAPGAHVEIAHMELAPPSIAEGFDACVRAGALEVVVVPYFLTPGRHALEDVPRLVGEAAARHAGVRHRVTPPLGPHGLLADLVVERAALDDPPSALDGALEALRGGEVYELGGGDHRPGEAFAESFRETLAWDGAAFVRTVRAWRDANGTSELIDEQITRWDEDGLRAAAASDASLVRLLRL